MHSWFKHINLTILDFGTDKTAERLSAWGSDELIFIDISRVENYN